MKEGNRSLRKAVWWSVGSRVSLALVLALCAAAGISVASPVRLALELTTAVPLLPVRKLMVHEARLFTSMLRWVAFRRHGVRAGDVAVPYASGGAAVLFAFAYVSAIETVVLAFIIPWPVVLEVALALDVWGVYFIIAVYASFVVRPHVIHADGSLRLRYGALLDIRIPAQDIAAARVERRSARGKLAAVDADGCADLSQGDQTTVTVQLTRPVTFTRPLGKTACARTFRFYAADPVAAVAAIRPASPRCRTHHHG